MEMVFDPTLAALLAQLKLITSDPTHELLKTRLQRKEAELIKSLDGHVQELSQTPQTSLYKREVLEILKILKDLRKVLSRLAR
jgi:hypothetical protein